jgi:hypothetical protein
MPITATPVASTPTRSAALHLRSILSYVRGAVSKEHAAQLVLESSALGHV